MNSTSSPSITAWLDSYSTPSWRGHTTRGSARRSSASRIHSSRGDGGAELDDEVAVAAGEPGADPVPLVGLVEQLRVILDRGAQLVQPDRVGAPRVVDRRVDDEPSVGGEARSRGRAGDLIGELLAGREVAHVDRVALVALEVDAEEHAAAVVRDLEAAEREELVALGLDVPVEEHLLAGNLGIGRELRWRPVVRRGEGRAALDAVLAALDRAPVVPPVATAARDGEVGLEGASLDLLEDLLAQPLQVGGARLGVRVLGLEVREHVGIVLGAEPLVRVVERVAVVECVRRGGGRRREGGRMPRQRRRMQSRHHASRGGLRARLGTVLRSRADVRGYLLARLTEHEIPQNCSFASPITSAPPLLFSKESERWIP